MFSSGQFNTPVADTNDGVVDVEPEIEEAETVPKPVGGLKRRSQTPAPERRRVYNQYDYQPPEFQQQYQPAPQYIRRDPEEIKALEDTITAHRAYAVKLKYKNKLYKKRIVEMHQEFEARNTQYQNEIQIARLSSGIPQGYHF